MKKIILSLLAFILFANFGYCYELTQADTQKIITTTNKFDDYIAGKGENYRTEIINQINDFKNKHQDNARFQELVRNILINIIDSTNIQTQDKILAELQKPGIPDLKFIYSTGALQSMPFLLDRLLEQKEKAFETLTNTPLEKVSFDLLEKYYEDDTLSYLVSLVTSANSVNSTQQLRNIVEDFQNRSSNFNNEIGFSKKLYEIYKKINENGNLNSEQQRIISLAISGFELNGINLSQEKIDRMKEINKELAQLQMTFENTLLDAQKNYSYYVQSLDAIKGIPEDIIESAHELATTQNESGYLFNYNNARDLIDYSPDENIRRQVRKDYKTLAATGDSDSRETILQILKLRKELASILGFKNYAEYSLSTKMARTPETVIKNEDEVLAKAKEKADSEIKEIKDYFNLTGLNIWDLSYYSRILQEQKYEVDSNEIRNYLELGNVKKGLFNIANKLYGLELKQIDAQTYGDGVEYYEVYKNGTLIGYYILDPFYNPNKESGAWANFLRYRSQSGTGEILPIAIDVTNIQKGKDNTLLNHGDVITLFHEFGHAIHALAGTSKYPQLNGFNIEWDFVETPSQLMENWARGTGLQTFAKNYETGEPMSNELVEKLTKLKTFMSGISTCTNILYSRVDMMLHTQNVPNDVEGLDKEFSDIIESVGYFKNDTDNKMYGNFSHIWVGGYAAGYYSYLRSEIIESDIFSVFKKNGIFDKDTANSFYEKVLSKGSSKPAIELFKDFMGRDISLEGLFEKKGFDTSK